MISLCTADKIYLTLLVKVTIISVQVLILIEDTLSVQGHSNDSKKDCVVLTLRFDLIMTAIKIKPAYHELNLLRHLSTDCDHDDLVNKRDHVFDQQDDVHELASKHCHVAARV